MALCRPAATAGRPASVAHSLPMQPLSRRVWRLGALPLNTDVPPSLAVPEFHIRERPQVRAFLRSKTRQCGEWVGMSRDFTQFPLNYIDWCLEASRAFIRKHLPLGMSIGCLQMVAQLASSSNLGALDFGSDVAPPADWSPPTSSFEPGVRVDPSATFACVLLGIFGVDAALESMSVPFLGVGASTF